MTYIPVWQSEQHAKLLKIERLQKLRAKLMQQLIQVHRQLEKERG